jgi:polycomb protein EED
MRFSLFDGCPPLTNDSSQSSTKSTSSGNGNPVLAFCNQASKVFFWDLSRLENYHDTISPYTSDSETFTAPAKHPFLHPFQNRKRGGGALGRLSTKRQRTTSPTESTSSSQVTASDELSSSYRDESQEGRGRSRKSQHASSSFNSSSSLSVDKKEEKERSRSDDKGPGKVDWVKTRKGWSEKYDMGDPLKEIAAHWTDVVKGLTVVGRQVAWSPDGKWCVVVGSDSVIACFQRWKD